MKLIEHYVALVKIGCAAYGQMNEMTLTEVADCLFCTERNAKLILHKLENKNWIIRESGAGRGRKSKIAFLRQPEELLLQTAKEYTMAGKLKRQRSCFSSISPRFRGFKTNMVCGFLRYSVL